MPIEPKGGLVTTVSSWLYWTLLGLQIVCSALLGTPIFGDVIRALVAAVSLSLAIILGIKAPPQTDKNDSNEHL